jgi:small subunit ribosomal protein S6
MRRYETIYILRPSQSEEEITTIIESTNKIITDDGGSIIELDKWGMRKLAYPIDKEIQGYYIYCDYAGTPAAVAEAERKFRIDDAVLRYMTIKTTDAISDQDIANATGEVAARKEAVAQASEAEEEQKEEKNAAESKETSATSAE